VVWEIAIKKALGKLDAPDDLEAAMAANRFLPLPVTIPHALATLSLPHHHRDPFDRLLSQANYPS
jgi:PIN domain nuclease of toxin-antitoxin system